MTEVISGRRERRLRQLLDDLKTFDWEPFVGMYSRAPDDRRIRVAASAAVLVEMPPGDMRRRMLRERETELRRAMELRRANRPPEEWNAYLEERSW